MNAGRLVQRREPGEIHPLPLSPAEFLDWAEGREGRFEFVDGVVIAMAPEMSEHVLYKDNILAALRNALARSNLPLRAVGDGIGVAVPEGSIRQPDVSVNEGPVPRGERILPHPFLLVEVSSRSTAATDELHKLREYLSIPSVRHYLVAYPQQRVVAWHERADANADIATRIVPAGPMTFTPYDLTITVEECFDDSAFE